MSNNKPFAKAPSDWLQQWLDPQQWRYRRISPSVVFRPWSERLGIVSQDYASREEAETIRHDVVRGFPCEGAEVFPALEGHESLKADTSEGRVGISRGGVIRYVPPMADEENVAACEEFLALCARAGIECETVAITLVDENAAGEALLFGRVTTNRTLAELGRRLLWGHPDETFPACGEMLLSYRRYFSGSLEQRYVVAAAGEGMASELGAMLYGLLTMNSEGEYTLPLVHQISPEKPGLDGAWREWAESWQALNRHGLPPLPEVLSSEHLSAHFSQMLNPGSKENDYYNSHFISSVVHASQLYAMTGDSRAIDFFKRGLIEICHYFLGENSPLSYPSDFHFFSGPLVHEFARWEELPLFNASERTFIRASLLSMMRIVFRYYRGYYYHRILSIPGALEELAARPPQNHQTFACRSLTMAASYFERFGIEDAAIWKQFASELFSARHYRRIKQCENANLYEWLAYDHAAAYSLMTWGDHRLFGEGVLSAVAHRQELTLDPSFYPVDYGDADVTFTVRNSFTVARLMAAGEMPEAPVPFLAATDCSLGLQPASPIWSILGYRYRPAGPVGGLPAAREWEIAPLEPEVATALAPERALPAVFDKAAYRSGWGNGALYLLLEGFGNKHFSHAHNSVLAVERFVQDGRIWLISNGYGKPVGETRSNIAYFSRELGPTEHNMLVFGGEAQVLPPPCATLLRREKHGRLATLSAELEDYGGARWRRHLAVLDEGILIVFDSLQPAASPKEEPVWGKAPAWLEWNLLGTLEQQAGDGAWCAKQAGSALSLFLFGGREIINEPRPQREWHAALQKGGYPFWSGTPSVLKIGIEPDSMHRARTIALFTTRPGVHASMHPCGSLGIRLETGEEMRLECSEEGRFSIRCGETVGI